MIQRVTEDVCTSWFWSCLASANQTKKKKRERIGDNMGVVGSNRQCSLSGGLSLPQVSALAGQQIPFDNILFAMPHFLFSYWKCLCWICFLLTSWASLSLLFPPCACQQGSHIRCASARATVKSDWFSRPDNQNQNSARLLKLLTLFAHASAFPSQCGNYMVNVSTSRLPGPPLPPNQQNKLMSGW